MSQWRLEMKGERMEIGESVDPPEFVIENDDVHDENTCPWCQPKKKEGESQVMATQNPSSDAVGAIPPNDGGTLGDRMRSAGSSEPRGAVTIVYRKGAILKHKAGRRFKEVRKYEQTSDEEAEEYDLQYAPHHLVPGNESLKGSGVVGFMGETSAIKEYAGGQASKIKTGGFIGYDVNAAANGEWLPSPYALSMCNDWPAEAGVKAIKKRRGIDLGPITEDFKAAYVAAAIEESEGRQFHMRHLAYSEKVRDILNAVGRRVHLMSKGGKCPAAKATKESGKFEPPYGLVARLNVLSGNLRRLLCGPVWRPPLFADSKTEEYANDLARTKAKGQIEKVV